MIICSLNGKILYASESKDGKIHDYRILKEEFPQEVKWFSGIDVHLDLGYIGFRKEYPDAIVNIPHKRKKKSTLSEQQKDENKKMASKRIKIEHSIGGMKKYRILSDRLRIRKNDLYSKIIAVCAAIWGSFELVVINGILHIHYTNE